MTYLPSEIWRIIFSFDPSYHEKYRDCMDEMSTKSKHRKVICELNHIISRYCFYSNDFLFKNDMYHNINMENCGFIGFVLRINQ